MWMVCFEDRFCGDHILCNTLAHDGESRGRLDGSACALVVSPIPDNIHALLSYKPRCC